MLGKGFVEKYYRLSREKDSFLCVGLDPATASMRERFIVPKPLVEEFGVSKGIKKFCIDIIEAVSPFAPVIKPNAQFLAYPLSFRDLCEIVDKIHEGDCLALLDAKLSDIRSSNQAALYWINEIGFDAVTFNPFQGYKDGTDVIYEWADRFDKGVFALCRMSNPGTHDYQSMVVNQEPLYIRLARDAFEKGANGFVVGCTATHELEEVRRIIGEERIILSPGMGPQGGDPAVAIKSGANKNGEGLIISSSRTIDYAYEMLGWSWERFAEAAAIQADAERRKLNEYKIKAFR
ncbi:orotidine-5'-phosphate decarboxylase [Candidatus Bathyarchaeota archaeon]|nr:orotidine-5'-phosphate decarboxylase [Candidatus Bathyarchaeota archaeon]